MAYETKWDDFSVRQPHRNVALVVEERKFWVSKEGLADYSPVFSALFYDDFQESTQDEIPLPNKNIDDILEMLRCLFPTKGKKKVVDCDNVIVILKLADEYQIAYLQEECSKFFKSLVEQDAKILQLFTNGIEAKNKTVVRAMLPLVARFNLADLQSIQHLGGEVFSAVLYQKITQITGVYHDYGRWSCYLCNLRVSHDTPKIEVPLSFQPCFICRLCNKTTILDSQKTASSQVCCRCVADVAAAELEKVDL